MKCKTIFATALLALCLTASPSALAQGRRGMGMGRHPAARPERPVKAPRPGRSDPVRTPIDEFQHMSPDQRQAALSKLPPERADKLRKQLQEYSQLTPEQQTVARERLEAFRNLPPERQAGMRKAFNSFSQQAPERQQAMRQELNQLRGIPEAERQARFSSPDFKGRFSGAEQKIIGEMSDLPPER